MAVPVPPHAPAAQGERSREEILDAAERLMGTRGYAATSISLLAKASGLPPSSIYWHFGSKSGLLGAVMQRGARRFFAAATPDPPASPPEPRERLALLVGRVVSGMREHPRFLRLVAFLLLGGDGGHDQHEAVAGVRAEARGLVRRGLLWAYLPWGEPLARRVADELTDTAQALFDGLFLTTAGGTPSAAVARDVEAALHALAEQVRDGPERSGGPAVSAGLSPRGGC
ncbi:TetR/AcrR family transcriptional regulator [Pseudonocardia humida]|uniref:TetR/AcrR family transcriptional regulator n=1 Tax=Pseudonocardia humida TaxID=2800819 RepID=A0ABT1A9X8_9PSEU|nr:TetR/AcrR family transcriptional regulator [Pseudonocardia humida]MCO1659798.1 TetR/AcrR family transcriptional regulator [Pseudonocardia humida]